MKRLYNLLRWAGLALIIWALYLELSKPPEQRTWHGRLAGFVPYDFRIPTWERLRAAYWNPEADYLFTDRVLGVGWAINIPVLVRRLQERMRAAA